MCDYISELLAEKGFINGIYVPWFHKDWFGHDIGKSVYDDYKNCFFNENYIRRVLHNCKVIDFDMVKIWLNESFEGILFDENGSVIGVEPTFKKNFIKLLSIVTEYGLKISLCINAHQETDYSDNKFLYDKYMRYIYSPIETEKYILNWLNPILNIVSDYNCVAMIDIYAEPEADGGGWEVSRGFSWNTMIRFINRVHRAIKEKDPRLATTVSSGASTTFLSKGKYNTVEVDYLGADIYTDDGCFENTKDIMLDRPFMLGEYGLSNYSTATDDDQVSVVDSYLKNCLKYGVAAAFYWCYGWKCDSAGEMHLVNSEGDMRKAAAYFHFVQLDRKNTTEDSFKIDKPALLSVETPLKISWFKTRGADRYVVQRKVAGGFKNICEIDDSKKDDYLEIMKCCDNEGNDSSIYRVVSIMPDGSTVISNEVAVLKGCEI